MRKKEKNAIKRESIKAAYDDLSGEEKEAVDALCYELEVAMRHLKTRSNFGKVSALELIASLSMCFIERGK